MPLSWLFGEERESGVAIETASVHGGDLHGRCMTSRCLDLRRFFGSRMEITGLRRRTFVLRDHQVEKTESSWT
jgi:hypothetical protein